MLESTWPRRLERVARAAARQYPIVTITGPRQSGKTTLCRRLFRGKPYVNLEPLDAREFARSDPRGFLAQYRDGAILDEVQHVPGLFSYLQEDVDRNSRHGRFVLTGSQHFGLTSAIAQSLAGRAAVLYLLPLSLDEREKFPDPLGDLDDVLWQGAYPRIHAERIPAGRWLADYLTTYVQRDVRQLSNISDLETFTRFVRLCAGRTAQELNLSALGADAGVSHNTARAWLGVLEASFVVFRVAAWHRNIRKQLVRSPKLHFVDSGLACHLLGIGDARQLRFHPLRGALFESWVASEVLKQRLHSGRPANLFHFRESRGVEVDLIVEDGPVRFAAEAKAGQTVAVDFFSSLKRFSALIPPGDPARTLARVVYGGEQSQERGEAKVVSWRQVADERW